MSQFDRFGIARDHDGGMDNVVLWAWYWRYGVGIALIGTSLAYYVLTGGDDHGWKALILPGIAVLFALMLMRELGCLVVVLLVLGALWIAIDVFFPESNKPFDWRFLAIVVFAYYAWYVGNGARILAEENRRIIESLWDRIGQLENDPHGINNRLSEIEDRFSDYDSTDWQDAP